ncbi:MAG: sensor histidine kinase, partial [Pseudomonadota bacterium]|nr:sensor histidine kinase [Pseudomonadota bacterium]
MLARLVARTERLGARALRAAAMCLALVATAPVLGAAPAAGFPILIDHALAIPSDATGIPIGTAATPVTLPDRWAVSRPGYSGGVWYRTGFRLDGVGPTDDLLALYIQRACSNLQVQLNGHLVFSGGRMVEPVTRNCGQPQLVALPAALLTTGENTLDLRLVGYAQERVGSVQVAAGLSRLEIAPQSALLIAHAPAYFWNITWTSATGFALIGIGCVLLAVGWLNRHEVYFSYLGTLCLAWVVVSLAMSARDMPWRSEVTEFLLSSVWAVLLALAVQFFLSFAGVRSRVIETLIALQWFLMPLLLILAGPDRLFVIARVWYSVLAVELLAVMVIHLWLVRHRHPLDFGPMLLLLCAATMTLGFELAVQWELVAPPPVSAANLFAPLALAALGSLLFMLFARALRATAEDRNRVREELNRMKASMEERIGELTAQRVGQFTELERRRIASDLHDDLGAKLLTIVHTSDTARMPQLAREALEEMRLSVRGLAGKAVRLDDAIADWRAEVVGRLEQAGVRPRWDSP